MAHRYRRGERWMGLKMGFTSEAKMQQMGVHDMIWGRLTDQMFYPSGSTLPLHRFIHPRAEPEIAFRLARPVDRVLTLETAMDYVDGVALAIEIIDSRYKDFKFSLEDVVADNCSSTGFSLGEWQTVDTPIQAISMQLLIDDAIVQQGNSNAILGNPWASLVAASRLANQNGESLPAGAIILAGAATPAVYIQNNQHIVAEAPGLGKVVLRTE
ncbi:MAG: fumarylacetoacetate hydrolase family protein [Bacteroidota bacterium]